MEVEEDGEVDTPKAVKDDFDAKVLLMEVLLGPFSLSLPLPKHSAQPQV